jgi:hypothetical protein
MERKAGWVQQRQSGIGFNELSSMVAELVSQFEQRRNIDNVHTPDWVSPSTRTNIIRHGSSSSLYSLLNQVPSAVSSEYEVLYRGAQVFTWSEYLWPHLQQSDARHNRSRTVYLPQSCLNELMDFHVRNNTPWLQRYQIKLRRDRAIEIDKISVMAQSYCIELS